ncbi:unnamed protein product [Sphenostylis stenocarpa]|uniref:Uncharacterized protein n=1 Tax=Sphenostylis stenocarpa TaxID=92480 RepID=A0AA86VE40_9FABA|nr:unnamed protein product [Sphenostylis stenocarpa]
MQANGKPCPLIASQVYGNGGCVRGTDDRGTILAPTMERGLTKRFGPWNSRTNQGRERQGCGCHAVVRGRREFVARGFVCEKWKRVRRRWCGA